MWHQSIAPTATTEKRGLDQRIVATCRQEVDRLESRLWGANRVLSQLYLSNPSGELGERTAIEFRNPYHAPAAGQNQGLPLPPLGRLTMGYGKTAEDYLARGKQTAAMLRSILQTHGLELDRQSAAMDWGCTTGRVLRQFAEEAETAEFWGVDVDRISIEWAKANLSPPFHFLCGSNFPYLPFPEAKFSLIYGISVMTHLEHFRDMWLMEIRRILRPGGLAILTVHDEHTLKWLRHNKPLPWVPAEFNLDEAEKHELSLIRGAEWFQCYTFFRSDYLRREWGQYYEVLEIRPYAEGYQSAVVLRKPR